MERIIVSKINKFIDKKIKIEGWVYRIRKLKEITFLILRDRSGLVQCVIENKSINIDNINLESAVSVYGEVKKSKNALNPFEILIEEIQVISEAEELPIEINKKDYNANLETTLNNRAISLRHEKINSIFKIQNIIVQSFRGFLIEKGFTEIFTPKIELKEAIKIIENKYNKKGLEGDLDPEEEKLICKYAREELGCDFIFITNYPRKKRPMYTMPLGEEGTRSFDLIFRGVEITSGGQRIHNYNMLISIMKEKDLNPNDYEGYTEIF